MPFYKAKNYEIAFLSKKRLLVKKRDKVSSVPGRCKHNYCYMLLTLIFKYQLYVYYI